MPDRWMLSCLLALAVSAGGCTVASPAKVVPTVVAVAPRPADAAPRLAGALTQRDIAYADGPRTMDLYLPGAGPAVPVVVWLHGGSWVAGDKAPVPGVVMGLRDRGFAVASVNYRLTGLASFPAQLHDVKGAVRWLRAHAAEYGLDPARIYFVGFSAGAHLASLAALTADDPSLEGDVGGNVGHSSAVAGVVAYAGPSDIGRLAGECAGCAESEQSRAFGCAFLPCGAMARTVSPLAHVGPGVPPFLLIHGEADRVVPAEQSRLLDAALREAGASSRLVSVPGGAHGLQRAPEDEATWSFLLGLAAADARPRTGPPAPEGSAGG